MWRICSHLQLENYVKNIKDIKFTKQLGLFFILSILKISLLSNKKRDLLFKETRI